MYEPVIYTIIDLSDALEQYGKDNPSILERISVEITLSAGINTITITHKQTATTYDFIYALDGLELDEFVEEYNKIVTAIKLAYVLDKPLSKPIGVI